MHDVFPEERVFRIDHFLGREAVQNLIALRFANGMFEPVWNRDHIDHVQIDVPETLPVDDRAGFYEETGAYRDMVVTHLFHVLGFVAMEPPTTLEARSIVEETGKVFRSVSPISPDCVIRGQHAGYREVPGVDPTPRRPRPSSRCGPASTTGAGPACRSSCARASAWPSSAACSRSPSASRRGGCSAPPRAFVEDYGPDHISFDLGDPGGITTSLPGQGARARRCGSGRRGWSSPTSGSFGTQGLEPYERLLYDAMLGDRTLFTDADGIERLWAASSELLDDPPPLHRYTPGSYGPQKMHELIAPRRWWLPRDVSRRHCLISRAAPAAGGGRPARSHSTSCSPELRTPIRRPSSAATTSRTSSSGVVVGRALEHALADRRAAPRPTRGGPWRAPAEPSSSTCSR